jgi:ubiquinone/menaquinone biosynthesis C-methylase UbiE
MSFYDDRVLPHLITAVMDNKETRRIRARVCGDLAGEVVEIGFGTGHNLPFIPAQVTGLRAVEPSVKSVRLAADRMAAAPVQVEIVGLDGQSLPIGSATADAVLCTWSLCTIPDATAALREMRRVLRPGGTLHFVEHGAAPDGKVRRWQDRLNGFQNRVAGGCNLNRDIPALIEAGGFRIAALDTYYGRGQPKPLGYLYEGRAVPT